MTPRTTELSEAARLAPAASGRRFRLARETRGWTQRALADRMASDRNPISAAALSQIEAGHSAPSARTLLGVAAATGFPLDYFVRTRAEADLDGFFRSLRSAPARERRQATAQAHLLHDFVRVVEDRVELPDLAVPRLMLGSATEDDGIEAAAESVRRAWNLGVGPISNVVRELEKHGVVATRLALASSRLDAFSVWFNDRPIIALGTNKGSTARSRFDAAHELAHGVLHGPTDAGSRVAEEQAHRFAAAFLMPAEGIASFLPSAVNWRQLMDVKAMWGVSLAALLKRANDLGVLSTQRYVSAMKYMSARGWRRSEPGDRALGSPEEPRLIRSALRHLQYHGVRVEDLAIEAGLPVTDVTAVVSLSSGPLRRVEP